nr:helix-turn-helix domain-containing protein [Phycisphaerae bacterium]
PRILVGVNVVLERFERDYLVGLLKLTDGNVADAARLADRNRTEFYRLLQKYGLTPGLFRNEPRPDGTLDPAPPATLSPIGDK